MRAITLPSYGGPEALTWANAPDPKPEHGEVLVDVVAAGVNRADTMQRQGRYAPPAGASEILGLECSGRIAALGPGVTGWKVGDEVCALLSGGGYAERVAVPIGQLLPIPTGLSLTEAASLPEVACTVWSAVFMTGKLQPGEVLLVHGGASGIGTMAIQLGVRHGARVFVTAGSPEKVTRCRELGAEVAIEYNTEDFVDRVTEETATHGADVILDIIGAAYLRSNVEALAEDGRLVIIATQGGRVGELDLGKVGDKRAAITATRLRSRTRENKAAIVAAVLANVWPAIESGEVHPVIDRTVPMAQASEAHRVMESGEHVGKIVLTLD